MSHDVLPESHGCAHLVFAGRRFGDPPEPPEYCEELALDGEEYCERHVGVEDGPDPDEQYDRERDDEL